MAFQLTGVQRVLEGAYYPMDGIGAPHSSRNSTMRHAVSSSDSATEPRHPSLRL
jgi:hypothetical protein